MVKINMGSKGLVEGVKYIRPVTELTVGSSKEDKVLFLAETLHREVIQGTEKQQMRNVKLLKKILKGFVVKGGVGAIAAPKTFAATALVATTTPITPVAIMDFGLSIAFITVACGIALSMSMFAIAGIFRMFKKRDLANEWSTDIVKGLVQVLIAIPVVFTLFYIAQWAFKHLPNASSLF